MPVPVGGQEPVQFSGDASGHRDTDREGISQGKSVGLDRLLDRIRRLLWQFSRRKWGRVAKLSRTPKAFRVPFLNKTIVMEAILPLTGTLTVAVGVALARDHLRSACRFARLAYRLEGGTAAIEPAQERFEHDSFVAASIIFASAFLDSEVNYQFATAAEGADPNALPIPMRGQSSGCHVGDLHLPANGRRKGVQAAGRLPKVPGAARAGWPGKAA